MLANVPPGAELSKAVPSSVCGVVAQALAVPCRSFARLNVGVGEKMISRLNSSPVAISLSSVPTLLL